MDEFKFSSCEEYLNGNKKQKICLGQLSRGFKFFIILSVVWQIALFALHCILILRNGKKIQEPPTYSGVLIFGGSEDSDDIFEVAYKSNREEPIEFCSITSAMPDRALFGAQGVNFGQKNGQITFCGGSKNSKCFELDRDRNNYFHWREKENFELNLQYASTLRISEDEWWIAGGRNGSNKQTVKTSTLFHRRLGFALGPNLPEARYGHCLIDVSQAIKWGKSYMLVGGRPLSRTAYIGTAAETASAPRNTVWFKQPNMQVAREGAACALLRNDLGEFEVVVAGGGKEINSVEVFSLTSLSWRSGRKMLAPFHHGLAVKWGESEMLVLGGKGGLNDTTSDEIYLYDHGRSDWRHLRRRMRRPRAYFTGIQLVENAADFC